MALEIVSPGGAGGKRWLEALSRLPMERRDIHALPEYGRIYERCFGFEAHLAVFHGADAVLVQPFMRRPLAGMPFLSGVEDAGTFCDIANAYGYGGPVCSASGAKARKLYEVFAAEFAIWCEAEGIASEFCSLHPLMSEHQCALFEGSIALDYIKDVVVIDLDGGETEMLKGLRKGHRSSISAARRAGVRVETVEATPANLDVFREMYLATMKRREAASRWWLPEDFFPATVQCLGPSRTTLLFAFVNDAVESGCLLIHDFTTAYYHFAGTFGLHPSLGVNNLLVWEAAIYAKMAGYLRLHLGGGVTASPDDSLFRFKAGFTGGRAPLHTYFTVRNQAAYDQLCERKRRFEIETAGAEVQSDFLPLYRR
jgi:serine/alanine adding enzyme